MDVTYTINVVICMLSIATDVIVAISLACLILWIDFKLVLFSVTTLPALLFLPSALMNLIAFPMLLIVLLYLLFSHGNLVAILPIIGLSLFLFKECYHPWHGYPWYRVLGNVRQYHAC
ncbi:hypothetical protein [Coxiella-like endosymbiont]|uniref:hypothetical protein n=1 Tax=Coxiella-like endosymbiont TaxID=1592897 RepID=UPI00272CDAA5|nr:hypothetical protein [Coxiella-like endosymbiont]